MIKIKVLEYEFTYRGNISIRMDNVFIHIRASSCKDGIDINAQDSFLVRDIESIKGSDDDQ